MTEFMDGDKRHRVDEPIAAPEGEVGCYVLHLYCQDEKCECKNPRSPAWRMGVWETTGRNLREARKEARDDGWVRRKGQWYCPNSTEK